MAQVIAGIFAGKIVLVMDTEITMMVELVVLSCIGIQPKKLILQVGAKRFIYWSTTPTTKVSPLYMIS